MGWFTKPKEDEVRYTKLPKEGEKLNSYDGDTTGRKTHPVVVIKNNDNGTSNVIGCSTKEKKELGDIKLDTTPPMPYPTYARVKDGERIVDTNNLIPKGSGITCNNTKDLKK